MAGTQDNAKRGDRVTADSWREVARQAKRGARPLGVVENSGLTVRDTPAGWLIGTDARQFQKKGVAVAGIRYGFVLDASLESKPYKVLVQPLKDVVTVNGESETVAWVNDGSPIVVSVPPRFLASDFLKLVAVNGVFTQVVPVVRLDKEGGKWRISIEPRWAVRTRPPTGALVRCPR